MRWFTLALALATLTCGSAAQAAFVSGDVIWLRDYPSDSDAGGIFGVTEPGAPSANYLFLTFCSNLYEAELDYNTDYKAIITNTTESTVSGADGIPVGEMAAWLYTQFIAGNNNALTGLKDFNFALTTNASNGNSTAQLQAKALQFGIWLGMNFTEQQIKDETGWSTSEVNTLKSTYVTAWMANYNASGWTGTGKVKILSLYGEGQNGQFTRTRVQDQLIEVPEPAAAIIAIMLSAPAIAASRRNRRHR